MRQSKNDKYSFTLCLFHETPKAYLVGKDPEDRENEKGFWLPKSQVNCPQFVQKNGIEWGDFIIPEWLAEKNDLDVGLDGDLIDD